MRKYGKDIVEENTGKDTTKKGSCIFKFFSFYFLFVIIIIIITVFTQNMKESFF